MLIIEESQRKSIWRFCLFFVLFLDATYDLFWVDQSVASSLYNPIRWFLFGTMSFFSFLQIFYRRETLIEDGVIKVVMYRFLKNPHRFTMNVSQFNHISLKWHYKSRFIPRPNLQVLLEHGKLPSLNILLKEAPVEGNLDELRKWAKEFAETHHVKNIFDESLQVSQ